jgi:hypothetical protein
VCGECEGLSCASTPCDHAGENITNIRLIFPPAATAAPCDEVHTCGWTWYFVKHQSKDLT